MNVFFYRASNPWAAKNSGSEAMRRPCQSEALRRTSLGTITWGQGVPEKRVLYPFPVAVPLPLFLMPDCLFVEPRARRLKSIFNGQNGGGQKLRQHTPIGWVAQPVWQRYRLTKFPKSLQI